MVPVRKKRNRLEVCLIRRRRSRRWGIPKGFVDPGDTPQKAGLTEAIEEAGLRGRIRGRRIGTYGYDKFGKSLKVGVYLMKVHRHAEGLGRAGLQGAAVVLSEAGRVATSKHPVHTLWDRAMKHVEKEF